MSKQQDEYARKRRNLQEYQKALIKAVRVADKHLQNDPRFKGFGAIPMVKAYVRNPKGKTKAILRLIDRLIEDKSCSQTNKALLEQVRPEFLDIPLRDNLFSQKLHKAVLKKIQDQINGNMANPVSIEKCKTLSDVRKRFKVAYLGKSKTITLKATFIFSKSAVVINGKPYSFTSKKSKGHAYKMIKFKRDGVTYEIRAKALTKLLSTTN